ncbi:winged helix-turn-helix transcriptional regulator [Nocardia sp. NPDC055321]
MARICSVANALEVVGEQWALLALREIFLGVRRFDAIQAATGAPRAVLVRRLNTLVEAGVLERRDYREPGARTRQEYRLTEAGRELQPVLTALMQWGDRHLAGPAGPPLAITHTDCGAPVRATLCCEHGHQLADSGHELTATPLPPQRNTRHD